MLDFGYFGPGNVADLLGKAYADYDFFIKKEWPGKHVSHLKHFTKELFHYPRKDSFPYARPKGADVMLITRWLNTVLAHGLCDTNVQRRQGVALAEQPLQDFHRPFLQTMTAGNHAALSFFRTMHQGGIWFSREVARKMSDSAHTFTDAYTTMAKLCHRADLPRFHLEPSLHYWHHFGVDWDTQLERGDPYILSCGIDNCESDEDYVGKLARLSRQVHAATVTLRSIERYLLKCRFEFTGDLA